MRMLTLGSVVLALVNVVVMWGMAHRRRYAWHGNLGLQLLWLPYDYITRQYGLLGLGAVMTVVSIKGCLHKADDQPEAVRSRSRHRRPRQGWFSRRAERTSAAGLAASLALGPAPPRSREVAAAGAPACVPHKSTSDPAVLARRRDRRRQLHAALAHRREQAIRHDRRLVHIDLRDVLPREAENDAVP